MIILLKNSIYNQICADTGVKRYVICGTRCRRDVDLRLRRDSSSNRQADKRPPHPRSLRDPTVYYIIFNTTRASCSRERIYMPEPHRRDTGAVGHIHAPLCRGRGRRSLLFSYSITSLTRMRRAPVSGTRRSAWYHRFFSTKCFIGYLAERRYSRLFLRTTRLRVAWIFASRAILSLLRIVVTIRAIRTKCFCMCHLSAREHFLIVFTSAYH